LAAVGPADAGSRQAPDDLPAPSSAAQALVPLEGASSVAGGAGRPRVAAGGGWAALACAADAPGLDPVVSRRRVDGSDGGDSITSVLSSGDDTGDGSGGFGGAGVGARASPTGAEDFFAASVVPSTMIAAPQRLHFILTLRPRTLSSGIAKRAGQLVQETSIEKRSGQGIPGAFPMLARILRIFGDPRSVARALESVASAGPSCGQGSRG
jgi:hypothetical protein